MVAEKAYRWVTLGNVIEFTTYRMRDCPSFTLRLDRNREPEKMKAPIIISVFLSVVLSGTALAQSHSHSGDKERESTSSHGAMGEKAAETDQMKKMEHGGSATGHHPTKSGHQHGETTTDHGEKPSQIDTATTKPSHGGHYRVSISPQAEPVTINTMHNWVLEVRTPDGKPVQNAEVSIDGGMPQHGHGLPTSPQVTKYLGDGKYLVEGLRFNMAGWWALKFDIAGHHADSANFNIVIE